MARPRAGSDESLLQHRRFLFSSLTGLDRAGLSILAARFAHARVVQNDPGIERDDLFR